MNPLPAIFRALLYDEHWAKDQTDADLAEGSRVVTWLLATDRCVALRSRRFCGRKGGPICTECRSRSRTRA